MANDWITTEQAVELSGYHREYLRERIRDGKIKARKFATVWQVNRHSLLAYMRGQEKRGEKRGPKR